MIQRGTTTYIYNGDGTLVAQAAGGVTTRYTQDLAAPLSQILQTSQGGVTANHLYGLNRLASTTSSGSTWYGYDALGSVRQTLSNTGTSLGVVHYDPWGTPESGSVPTFGFTGELQDGTSGLVNLRARWYDPGHGTFTAYRWRTSESHDTIPYSHHPYQYALSNPVSLRDPSGKDPVTCAAIAVADGLQPGPADLLAAGCLFGEAAIAITTLIIGTVTLRDSLQRDAFSLAPNAPPVSSAPHGIPESAPTPVPFPLHQPEQLGTTGIPLPTECPEAIVQPGPVPLSLPTTPVASTFPTPMAQGPLVLAIKLPAQAPHPRHYLDRLPGGSHAKERNTLILPGYERDVERDVQDINAGRYRVVKNATGTELIVVNGRYYAQEGTQRGTLYPVATPGYAGFVEVTRAVYKALVTFVQYKDKARALFELNRYPPSYMPPDAINEAEKLYDMRSKP